MTKLSGLAVVVVVLSMLLAQIDGLVSERSARQMEASHEVAQSLAGEQTIVGPLLYRQCREEWEAETGEGKDRRVTTQRRDFTLTAAPRELNAESQTAADVRRRGLFRVNAYGGATWLEARWDDLSALRPRREQVGSRMQCGSPALMVAVSDVRGLRAVRATVDGRARTVQAGTGHPAFSAGVHVTTDLPATGTGPDLAHSRLPDTLSARIELDLVGTAHLSLVPAAGQTEWKLRSDWPHPSFVGRFLPSTRELGASGFTAQWSVSSLASTAAAAVERSSALCARPRGADPATSAHASAEGCLESMGVNFINPVNPYTLTDRATKYALLFILLTFACVSLTEVLARRRVHPVQYTLVGLALALFYLLLLSLSEHMRFGAAYGWASAGCVLLLGFYATHMLGSMRAGLLFGAGMTLLYGLLWVLLTLEQAALVVGSLGVFTLLATVMVLTRRVDWYQLADSWRDAPAAHGQ